MSSSDNSAKTLSMMWVKNESKDTNCENCWKFDLLLHKMLKNVKTKKKEKLVTDESLRQNAKLWKHNQTTS